MSEVRIREENIIIPTYEVGAPDKNPMFLEKRVYQGSSGKIYPYPSTQEISRKKTDKTWKAVWLENEYIRVMVLPELGGRIQRAFDKTNNYDFVYYNHVIKPALVGLTGPWISGGIEFNWPQHHRPTTFSPVDYKIIEHPDGSKSLLTGDVDQMYGTKEITTFTLYPGKAYIEIRGQLYNRTPFAQTFLWWANPAVAVNDYTQSIFPPDVHNVYDHGKRAVSRFPIATGEYYKHDYSEGVDISRYRNIPVPTSYMAEKSAYDFVGGYDYQKNAGLLHVADHHISPGKKQWTWGCGDFGKAWDRNLTDEDGPYIELMTGMFCDNQPDFTWLKPHEEKVFCQYFMPYKAVGQVKNASIHAVVNVEQRSGAGQKDGLYICAYATERFEHAQIAVFYDGQECYREETLLSPNDIYEAVLPLDTPDFFRVKVSVLAEGRELVSYQPEDPGIPELAKPAEAAKLPEQIMTNEELFLTGQHIEQYRHATWLPDPYYLEGLKRDRDDIRINNAYGLLLLRRGCFSEAEKYFRRALIRLTRMNPNPYDSEPYYNLGLALFYQENYTEAFEAFYKAAWSEEQKERAFYFLAAIEASRGNFSEALQFIEKCLLKNAHNIKARGMKAALLLKLGKTEDAAEWIEENLNIDAFDFVSLFLKTQAAAQSKTNQATPSQNTEKALQEFHSLTRDFHESFLMAARDLAESGFYEEALLVLDTFTGKHPMIAFYRGAYLEKLGRPEEAAAAFRAAEKMSPYCCFPNKLEDIAVLEAAIRLNPDGAKAYYYLGCLYYDKLQYEQAILLWEKSEKRDDSFPTVHRNLAIAYYNKRQNPDSALRHMEHAFELDPADARVFFELDQLRQRMQIPPQERIKKYEKHLNLVQTRDDLYTELITLLNLCGRHTAALERIRRHTFRTWEGAEGKITTQFKNALFALSKEAFQKKEYEKARACILEALSYPENLGEGRLEGTKDNHLYYFLGLICEAQNEKEEAMKNFRLAELGESEPAGVMYYYDQPADMILYQGLAKKKLGKSKEANACFYRLLDYGEQHLSDVFRMDYFAVSMPDMSVFDTDMDSKNRAHCYYLMGLGKLGLGREKEAMADFEKVLSIDRSFQMNVFVPR